MSYTGTYETCIVDWMVQPSCLASLALQREGTHERVSYVLN